jgi:autotransporter-associated beta strand protein
MRLPKSSLVAAACLLTAAHSFAYQNVTILNIDGESVTAIGGGGTLSVLNGVPQGNNLVFNPAGGSSVIITAGQTLTINSEYATTVEASFQEFGETDVADMVTGTNGVVYKIDPLTGLRTGGNVVKTGGGLLQLNSFTGISGGIRYGFVGPGVFVGRNGGTGFNFPLDVTSFVAGPGSDGSTPSDLAPDMLGDLDGRNAYRQNGIQGTFTINEGTVRLSGFLNVWHDFGAGDYAPIPPFTPPNVVVETATNADVGFATSRVLAKRMTGVNSVILNGSSVLEFTNSPLNVPTTTPTNLSSGSALRYNFLHNVRAGLNDDQLQTEIIVGTTNDYRLILHTDQAEISSVGILGGAGSVVKTGAGSLTIINEATLTGDFTAAGGRTILDSAGGRALASVASVNLAGTMDATDATGSEVTSLSNLSRRGLHVRYLEARVDINADGNDETIYKQAFSPDVGTHIVTQAVDGTWSETSSTGAELEIRQDQLIHNFQSNFALKAAPSTTTTVGGITRGTAASAIKAAADSFGKGEAVIAGSGVGSTIYLNGNTLTISQEAGRDGFYEGTILGNFNYTAAVAATGTTLTTKSFQIIFDQTPGFGTYQLNLTDAGSQTFLTDAITVGSATDLQTTIAATLGLSSSAVSVTADTSGALGELVYNITLNSTTAAIASATNLNSGKVVLSGTTDAAKLALTLAPSNMAEIEVSKGQLVVNAQALGTSRVNISTGELQIFQNDAASLDATLVGSGVLRVVASALINNGSGTLIEINSSGNIGTLNFARQQRQFTGSLVVNDGVNISLSNDVGLINDTLINASAITLDGGTSGVGSTLSFNNTDQVVRNLSGDALSSVDLGRGTMTLDVTSSNRVFLGSITGVGSVIKTGGSTYNLRGNGGDDYTGATVVKGGAIALGSANALRKSSAFILAAGTTINANGQSQQVGTLFGRAGSTIEMGAATLTVGFTTGRYSELGQLFATAGAETQPLSHNYLGTTDALELYALPGYGVAGSADFDRTALRLDSSSFEAGLEAQFAAGNLRMRDQTLLYIARVLGDVAIDSNLNGVITGTEILAASANLANFTFAGTISGAGANQTVRYGAVNKSIKVSVNKTGLEELFLSGANTFTGALVIRQGRVQVDAGSLATGTEVYVLKNSGTIDLDGDGVIDAVDLNADTILDGVDVIANGAIDSDDRLFDGTLSVNVADVGTTANWSNVIQGDGNFAKTGAGTLVLNPTAAQYTGTTTVLQGTLDLTLVETAANSGIATLGDISVSAGGRILLRTPAAFTASSSISYVATTGLAGAGSFTKGGLGTLVISGNKIQLTGSVDVAEGVLAVDTLPNLGVLSSISVATNAEFRLTLGAADNVTLKSDVTGAGLFNRAGSGTLVFEQDPAPIGPAVSASGFTGTLRLAGGTTVIALPGSFPNARIEVLNAGTSLNLNPGNYAFAGLTGEAGTFFNLTGSTTLTLTVAGALQTDTYAGTFTGYGDLVKLGAGILRLAPTSGANNLGDILVSAGTLTATRAGLGNALSVTVASGATLQLESNVTWSDRTQPAPTEITYSPSITGLGTLSKSGTGDILLDGTGTLPTGGIFVRNGTLIVDDRRVGSSIPTVSVDAPGTFELLLTGNRSLTNQVTGAGGFSVSGGYLLTVLNQPLYTGVTRLRSGADLAFDAALTAPLVHGLAADASDNLVYLNPGVTLTIDQNTEASFAGQFSVTGGSANLLIQGTAAFRYTANTGDLSSFTGNVTVDGGILQVGVSNTKEITLIDSGTLQIFTAALTDQAYAGSVVIASGTSSLVKVGLGTLDLTAGLPTVSGPGVFNKLIVQEGKARVAVGVNGIIGLSQLAVSGTGSLEVSVVSGDATITSAIAAAVVGTSGGAISKTGAGNLILVAGITTTADLTVEAGSVQLGNSAANATALGGDATINAGATLKGSGTIAGNVFVSGTLAPGYSPGTIAVAGNQTFATGSTYDVEVSGSLSDLTTFGGSLTIANGATLNVTGWNNPSTSQVEGGTPGDTHAILKATGTTAIDPLQRFSILKTTAFGTASPQSLAYIVSYPGDTLGRAGEINVTVVRATEDGATNATSLVSGGVSGVSSSFLQHLSELARVEVDALGNVTDLTTGALGTKLAALSPTLAPGAIRSLTGMGYLSGIGMAHLAAAGDAEEIARRLEQRRFDRGYMSVKPREFFVTASSGSWKAGSETDSANYDLSRTGLIAGYDHEIGVDGIIGVALALDKDEATLQGGGTVDGTHARAMVYASTLFADDAAYAQFGASIGFASLTATRSTLDGNTSSSPSTLTMSAWTRVGVGMEIAHRTSFSPFAQLDVSYAKQDALSEQGNVNTALQVDALTQTAVRLRLGGSLAHSWDSDKGDWRYRASFDLAYVAALSGEEMDVVARNAGQLGDVTATANPLDAGGIVATPAFSFGPDNDTTYSVSAEFRKLTGGDATTINLSYRRRF